ncbi:N-acetylmuramoyl-L-alanine amidase [Paenibacillus harenae]|uniref:N-acetylmuramoyl-L-alanine amidase n=1 Tax=Paenibacillus harenae TaxID=306543 RepID=UPI000420FD5E|nr:N-acetylmuramoyl-L-alanine amidase [Paenibacillus harenae]
MPKYSYKIFDPKIDNIYAVHQNGTTVKELGQREKADVAINFSYANTVSGVPIGRLVVGGKTVMHDIDKTTLRDELYMSADGSLHIGKVANPVWAIQGSPRLLQDGKDVIAASVKRDRTGTDIYTRAAIRTAVGITAAGKLVMVRTYDSVTLTELAGIMKSLGCVDALNGDGGGSSYMWPEDDGYGRKLGAALIVKKGKVEPVAKPVLVINPGHGGKDPGASGNGIIEKDYTLKISLYQFERFKQLGVPVALTRSTDVYQDQDELTGIVRNSGAKYCISNHLNAATAESAQGAEAIHSIHSDGKLAHALVYAIRDAGQTLRKTPVFTKQRSDGSDYYFMHHDTGKVSTVIIEYGFMTNATDAERIKANWKAYAEAVVRSFCTFIGHPYTAPAAPVVTPPAPTGTFKDVPANHPARTAIEKAAKAGIINGIAPDLFGLGQPVTREQLVIILDRLGMFE